jgi:hypothetical protein
MKMILHILLKDLRRHWLEISAYLLVCATWAWREAHPFALEWLRQRDLIPILLFGLWMLITVRLVQGECLVGDREFWPTRPYRWQRLMVAKALALVLCLNLPLLVAQFYLLHHAGIPISGTLIPGLLFLQGMFILLVTFPVAVLATITASIVQWVITVVGLILAGVALSWIPWNKLPDGLTGGEDVASWIGFGILVPAMVLVIVWQFARRRETPARWLLGLSLLSIPLCILLSSTPIVRNIGYPHVLSATPVQFAITQAGSGRREYNRRNSIYESHIAIPVVDRAIDSDAIVKVDGYRAVFSGQGWRWEAPWKNRSITLTYLSPGAQLEFEMPDEIADKVAQGNTSVKVDVAFEIYRLDHAQIVDTQASKFVVPGVGFCAWSGQRARGHSLSLESCVAPLRFPPVRVTEIDAAGDACPIRDGDQPVPPGHIAYNVEFGTSGMPVEFDPNPVHNFVLVPSPWIPAIPDSRAQNQDRVAQFCQGTRFTIRTGRAGEQMRASFDLGDIGTERLVPNTSGEDDE